MGVQGLWQLLNPTGRPVSLQSLEGKVLAVDVSIWLHQAVKGMRDRHGNPLPNAHLQVLFNRLCKLLYYRIKPVFVFDGGVPVLKKQTMAGRREKKEFAEIESDKATKNLVSNLLKSHAINEVMHKGDKPKASSSVSKPSSSKSVKPDLFELPPLPEEFKSIEEDSRRTEFTVQERLLLEDVDLDQIDIESDVFNSLPPEMRHEVLTLLKEKKKRHTWNQILELPQESNDFSKFQMAKLMKQNELSSYLADVKKEMNNKRSVDVSTFLGDDFYSDAIETRRIMSDDTAHSVLIKGLGAMEQKEELERVKLKLEKEKNIEMKKEMVQDDDIKVEKNSKFIDFIDIKLNGEDKKIQIKMEVDNESFYNQKMSVQKDSPKPKEYVQNNTVEDQNFDSTLEDKTLERNDILKELQARMNALRDISEDGDGVINLNPLEETNGIQVPELEISAVRTVNKRCDDVSINSDEINTTDNNEVTITCGTTDGSLHMVEEEISANECNHISSSDRELTRFEKKSSVLSEKSSKLKDVCEKKSELQKTVESSLIQPKENLTSARISILDELRQKVNVLSSSVDEGENNNELKEAEIQNVKESEIEEFISNNKKAILRKQMSLDEEQAAKKQKLNLDNALVENMKVSPQSVPSSSDGDSEDEGFIEVTVDPERAEADELFPADIFQPVNQAVTESLEMEQSSQDLPNDSSSSPQEVTSESPDVQETVSYESSEETAVIQIEEKDHDDFPHRNLVEQFKSLTDDEIRGYQENLEAESRDIQKERGKQERLAVSITDQMYTEAQELLELFGVPYIISPMEAEAQCAQLDLSDLTQGTITDDSDIWLFGGKRVYKNFFNQDKHVEFFTEVSIKAQLGIGRDILIKLALLCGSDYTPGIQGVGTITAMELLTEFPGENLEGLRAFKSWWDDAQRQVTAPLEAKIKSKLRKLDVPEGFPNDRVVTAYLSPEVDDSAENFSWSQPELDLIRDFTKCKFGWNQDKCDESMIPMLKQLNLRHTQTRINSFFQPESFMQPKNIKSKRLQRALNIIQGKDETEIEPSGNLINLSITAPVPPTILTPLSKPMSAGMQEAKAMAIQITRGKGRGRGRGRGRGKGKGVGKSSVGQRRRTVVADEVNLSEESSSESSGDELIANLDYENIVEDSLVSGNASAKPETSIPKTGISIITELNSVSNESRKPAKRSAQTTSKPKQKYVTPITQQVLSNNTSNNLNNNTVNESQGVTLSQSVTDSSSGQGKRTRPKIRIGMAGHATEQFAVDQPKEPQKGFLEDEVKSFDKVKKTKSKTQRNETSSAVKIQKTQRAQFDERQPEVPLVKRQKTNNSNKKEAEAMCTVSKKVDKGKKLMKGNSPVKSSSNITKKSNSEVENVNKDNNSALSFLVEDNNIGSSSILSQKRTRSSRIGVVNRVMVMSDTDSD